MLSRQAVQTTLIAAAACGRRSSSAVLKQTVVVLVIIPSVTRRTGSVFHNKMHTADVYKVPKTNSALLPEQQRWCVVMVAFIDRQTASTRSYYYYLTARWWCALN